MCSLELTQFERIEMRNFIQPVGVAAKAQTLALSEISSHSPAESEGCCSNDDQRTWEIIVFFD